MITKHVLDGDHITEMKTNYFQDGRAAFLYLQTACQRTVGPLRIREPNKEFDDISILHDIGVKRCKRFRSDPRPDGTR